jgi:hypothetical protein
MATKNSAKDLRKKNQKSIVTLFLNENIFFRALCSQVIFLGSNSKLLLDSKNGQK